MIDDYIVRNKWICLCTQQTRNAALHDAPWSKQHRTASIHTHAQCVPVSTGQVGLVVGLLFAFLVLLPAVLLLFYCYRIKTSYYHKWLSQREKNKSNKYCVPSVTLLITHHIDVTGPPFKAVNFYVLFYPWHTVNSPGKCKTLERKTLLNKLNRKQQNLQWTQVQSFRLGM